MGSWSWASFYVWASTLREHPMYRLHTAPAYRTLASWKPASDYPSQPIRNNAISEFLKNQFYDHVSGDRTYPPLLPLRSPFCVWVINIIKVQFGLNQIIANKAILCPFSLLRRTFSPKTVSINQETYFFPLWARLHFPLAWVAWYLRKLLRGFRLDRW